MEQHVANVTACAGFLRLGYKRLARGMLHEGHAAHVFEAYAQQRISLEEAVELLVLHRTPWYVRIWWRK
jgi:hypothetical protein